MAEPQKRVMQRIVRGEDGRVKILYIDLDTLKYVDNPQAQGYNIVSSNVPVETVISVDEPDPQPTSDPTTEEREDINRTGEEGGRTPDSLQGQTQSALGRQPTGNPSISGTTNIGGVNRGTQNISSSSNNQTTSHQSSGNNQSNNSNNQRAGFVNDFASAGHRKGTPDQGFIDSVTDIAGKTLGAGTTVTGYSGKGEYGSARHRDERGIAMDASFSKNGQPLDNQKVAMEDVGMAYAAANPNAGIGYDKNYMGPASMHIDQYAKPGDIGLSWGEDGKRAKMDQNFANNLDFARETGIGPTPTFDAPTPFGPNDKQSAPTATGAPLGDLQGLAASSIDAMGNQRAGTVSNPALDQAAGIDMTSNPGALASLGYGLTRQEQEMADIGFAIAGELGPAGLKGVQNRDPEALQELSNIVSTIENRAAATNKSISDILSPSQYNSLMSKNLETTRANFTKYGDDIMSAVKDFYSPSSFNNPANATHYANLDIANPAWGAGLVDATKAGAHTFGRLSDEYSPNENFGSVTTNPGLNAYATDQTNNMSSKGGYQPDLGRFGDMTDSVSRSNGESQGGRGRGGYAAGGNSDISGSLGQESSGGRGRGGYAAGGNSETSSGGRSSGASDTSTSSYGGSRDSSDSQSSGRSGNSSSSGGKSGGGGRAGGVGTAGVGGGFSSGATTGGRTSGKTDDN